MIITALLIICAILFIIAMLHLTDTAYNKHDCKKYQEHIDDLVTELFPPSIPAVQAATSVQTSTQTPAIQTPTAYESDTEYQEAKRKMIADIRTYFNQRKINAAIRETEIKTGLTLHSPMFSSGPDTSSPSIERLME